MDFSKGSEAFLFMQDLFKFMKQYSEPKDTEEFWQKCFEDSEVLAYKYKNTYFYDMVLDYIVAFQNQLERLVKNV